MNRHRWIFAVVIATIVVGVSVSANEAPSDPMQQSPCTDPATSSAGAVNAGIPCTNPALLGEFPADQLATLARDAGFSGRMVIRITIDENGRMQAVALEKPRNDPALQSAVIGAISPLAFRPGTIRGKAVPAILLVNVLVLPADGVAQPH